MASADELADYRYQLEQIEASLESDPQNSELLKLKSDLEELISLTSQFETVQSSPATATKKPEAEKKEDEKPASSSVPLYQQYSVGQEVMAKYQGDGKYYKAKVSNVGGSGVVYSVIFYGYQDVDIVKAEDIKPIDNKNKNKRPAGVFQESSDKKAAPVKKPKKTAAVEVKKNAWLNFANKSEKKKKISATPINKKSMFKTPDNPEGKVGVIGSGRGMTDFQQRGKHQYSTDSNNAEED